MTPPWHQNLAVQARSLHLKAIIHEAYRRRLIVKRRPDTPLENYFMRLQLEQSRNAWRSEIEYLHESISQLDPLHPSEIKREEVAVPETTYSVKPQRGRRIVLEINGELWATARWLYFNLEYSIGFDSLTSWLAKYRNHVRRKMSPDGHVWLHNVADFNEWRKKSLNFQMRHIRKVQAEENRV